jgi:hypothetical protein
MLGQARIGKQVLVVRQAKNEVVIMGLFFKESHDGLFI